MTVDTILRLFSIIVGGLILVIVGAGGLILGARQFAHDPLALAKRTFPGTFILVLVLGFTTGAPFISPTDGWVEIITKALAFSLMLTVGEVIVAGAYFRWRKGK